ncbi:MAG: 50S ribosome-binding GTPase [Erysipelotrichaceae bacterium]|nr:50S ribosome-binding GTPase [Erysipelotrichaceae bacterium]
MNETKICKGCGAVLQNEFPGKAGYVMKAEQELCQRCFRIRHYNDLTINMLDEITNEAIEKELQNYADALFVVVTDILSFSGFLKEGTLKSFQDRKVLLLINKIDLLPKNANLDKVAKNISRELAAIKGLKFRYFDILLTHAKDDHFRELFEECVHGVADRIVFVGNFNTGKSSLINKLLGDQRLTVSSYPCTTLGFQEIPYGDYKLYDGPGSLSAHNLLMNIPQELHHSLTFTTALKPAVYQIYSPQSYFVEGLVRLDIVPQENCSVIFYLNNRLDIHRTKTENAERYTENNRKDFLYKGVHDVRTFSNIRRSDVEINGFGFITLKNVKKATVFVPENTAVTLRGTIL